MTEQYGVIKEDLIDELECNFDYTNEDATQRVNDMYFEIAYDIKTKIYNLRDIKKSESCSTEYLQGILDAIKAIETL